MSWKLRDHQNWIITKTKISKFSVWNNYLLLLKKTLYGTDTSIIIKKKLHLLLSPEAAFSDFWWNQAAVIFWFGVSMVAIGLGKSILTTCPVPLDKKNEKEEKK